MIFAKASAPVLNTPHFSNVFTTPLPLCDQGLLRPIEFIALPGTPFILKKQHSEWIYQVTTPAYSGDNLFVDRRFLSSSMAPAPTRHIPAKEDILDTLYSRIGLPYIWGGNWSEGIPELLNYYPPRAPLTNAEHSIYTLRGLDCSGLLYEATHGLTPRNTSELLSFGNPISIQGKSAEEIALVLQPLDMIIWKGHVVFVGRENETIESHRLHGVYTRNLLDQLHALLQTKLPQDMPSTNAFVVRRLF